jgi:hypothetical protein
MLDNDGKYSKPFIAALKKGKVKTQRTPILFWFTGKWNLETLGLNRRVMSQLDTW